MKRILVVAAIMGSVLLAGCGAQALSPIQTVLASADKMGSVKSMKMDYKATMSGTVSTAATQCSAAGELPATMAAFMGDRYAKMTAEEKAGFCAQLARQAKAAPKAIEMTMEGTGATTTSPRAVQMAMTTNTGGATTKSEMILAGGLVYFKDPKSGAWKSLDSLGVGLNADTFNQFDPAANVTLMEGAKSVTDLGDTAIGDVRAHHYRVELDPEKLKAKVSKKQVFKDPKMERLLDQYANVYTKGQYTLEAWVGIDDQLVRREVMDVGSGSAAGGSSMGLDNFKMHMQMDLHDFNSNVTIEAPKTS